MSLEKYAACAHELINEVITASLNHLQTELDANDGEFSRSETQLTRELLGSDLDISSTYGLPHIYLSIQDFTIASAEAKIHSFIKSWKYHESWLYCIDFLETQEYDYDVRFRFRVRWSIPTRRRPIPTATASVYFTFAVSKVKRRSHPVEVYYVFETYRLVHRPGDSRFREQWLRDIIENKVTMMESVCF